MITWHHEAYIQIYSYNMTWHHTWVASHISHIASQGIHLNLFTSHHITPHMSRVSYQSHDMTSRDTTSHHMSRDLYQSHDITRHTSKSIRITWHDTTHESRKNTPEPLWNTLEPLSKINTPEPLWNMQKSSVYIYYGVATISRLLKITGLICKRAL